jgi:hypothetical protein
MGAAMWDVQAGRPHHKFPPAAHLFQESRGFFLTLARAMATFDRGEF